MRNAVVSVLVAGSIGLTMPACTAYDQQSRTTKGAVLGTLGGAATGAAIGGIAKGGKGAAIGAAIGAVVGGVGGGLIGNYMDKQAAQMEAILSEQDRLRRENEKLYLTLGSDVLFDTGSSTLHAGARDKLRELSGVLTQYPRTTITVVGHTDSVGGDEMNQELSVRRAKSVASELSNNGVSSARIMTRGEGETRPIASNETQSGRQLNRRVDLVIQPDQGLRNEAAAG